MLSFQSVGWPLEKGRTRLSALDSNTLFLTTTWIMRLTIFSRLMIGYFIVFSLVSAGSLYAILKLHQLNLGTRHILDIDIRILDFEKILEDSILSQLRYEKKFVITKDTALYNQFLSKKNEFDKYLTEALFMADTPPKRNALEKMKTSYEAYQSLIAEEVEFIKTHRYYSKKWYEAEKEKAANDILEQLDMLVVYSQADIRDRTRTLRDSGTSARTVAIVMSVATIVLAIGTSFFLTKKITNPLSLLRQKTKEVSEGVFKNDLNISAPPEISELSKAFNSMSSKLQVVDRMKSDFFSMMSHELRTPLTSIKEGTSLLLEGIGGTITDKQEKLLTIVSTESRRLIDLVNSFLDLSKMEAGMMTYTFDRADLSSLIDKAMLEIAPLVESKKISLKATMNGKLPAIKVDRERILQVLRNLIGNAVKFTPGGGHVNISARPVHKGLEVAVADSGPGIPPEYLSSIFSKFQQAVPTGLYRTKGTGLGLAIAKQIILSHGGKIWAESEPGRGSTFIFVLPA